jgi:hypothetical protein
MRSIIVCIWVLALSTAHADLLKNRETGTIEAVGRLLGAQGRSIKWEDCDGTNRTIIPRSKYVWKEGTKDCDRGGVTDSAGDRPRHSDESNGGKWIRVPDTPPVE